MTIQFGDWRLVPLDNSNWELSHRHMTERGGNRGQARWHRLGRYYQCNTIHAAMQYAADYEVRHEREGEALRIEEALAAYMGYMDGFRNDLQQLLEANAGAFGAARE